MNSPTITATKPRVPHLAAAALLAAVIVLVAVLLIDTGTAQAPGAHRSARVRGAHRSAHYRLTEQPDPLAKESFPDPRGASTHARAAAPSVAAASASPGAPSLSTVQSQLAEEHKLEHQAAGGVDRAPYINPQDGALTPGNVVPLKIAEVIAGGNAIADFPYVYGGGHGSFVDRAYDCSGSVSYALAAAGLIGAPETSGQLESWGAPGPGRYMTIYANAGHTFMWVDGVWFDTAGRAGPYSTRWLRPAPSLKGYWVRHYPGL